MKEYKVINGTSFDINTSNEVARIIENARQERKRIRVFYGDTKTGKDWGEVYDTIGMIGRSCGDVKTPLLIKSLKSFGGGSLLTSNIVKITCDKIELYKHPLYNLGQCEIKQATKELNEKGYFFSVFINGKNTRNTKTRQQAENEILFLKGERNRV